MRKVKRHMPLMLDIGKCTVQICQNHVLLMIKMFLRFIIVMPLLHSNSNSFIIIANNNDVFLMAQIEGNPATCQHKWDQLSIITADKTKQRRN